MGRKIRILQPGSEKVYSYEKKKKGECTQGGDFNPTLDTMFVMTSSNACFAIVWPMSHLNLFKRKMS